MACGVQKVMAVVISTCITYRTDHLIGLVVKASASRVEDLGFEFCLQSDFSGSSRIPVT